MRSAGLVLIVVLAACSAPRSGLGGPLDAGPADLGAVRDAGADAGPEDLGTDAPPPDAGFCAPGTVDLDRDPTNGCEYRCTVAGAETCNGVDDDCDGVIDGPAAAGWMTFYADADADGHGSAASSISGCAALPGYVTSSDDCNDADATVHPGATELCDGHDQNCNGMIDDGAVCAGCVVAQYGTEPHLFCDVGRAYDAAEAACVSAGYHLATIRDSGEDGWVAGMAHGLHATGWWMGYQDRDRDGTYTWIAGTSAYTGWGPGEPSAGGEHCTLIAWAGFATNSWNNGDCALSFPFVCDISP